MNYRAIAIALIAIVALSAVSTFLYLSSEPTPPGSETLKVIATFYPLYDFATNVAGDKANVSILVPETVDVHSFDPTPSSILMLATANVIIYNGAGLEPWIPQIIAAADNPKLKIIDTSQGIALLPVASPFQRGNRTVDPHIWLDPLLAKQQVENILQGLINADPRDAQYFTENARIYQSKLDQLNSQIINATANVTTRNFVTFHESFAYLAKRYNLNQIPILGPFQEDPSPTDIQNVIVNINQYHLLYVGYESLENQAIPESIASQTRATLIPMNPIEGLTLADRTDGKNYVILMQEDLENLVMALNHVGT
jgi:zinc transport system substrate-binding protein